MRKIFLPLLLIFSMTVQGQSALDYPMPPGHSNGLVRPGFQIVPRFEFVTLGSIKKLYLKMNVKMSTARDYPAPFSFRYMHMGKEYTDNDLGKDPFTSIRLGNATFTVLVQGPSLNKRVVYSVSPGIVDMGTVANDALLQYYSAHVQSLDDVFYNGTESIVAAINQFERSKKEAIRKTENDVAPKKTVDDDAARHKEPTSNTYAKTNTTTKDNFWSEKKTTTSNDGGSSTEFGRLIPVQPDHKNMPNFVRTNDGGYYYKGADGRFRQVTAEEYQKAKDAAAARNKPVAQEQQQQPKMSAEDVTARLNQMNAENKAREEAIYNSISRFTNMIQQNFYYAEAIRNGKQNLAELSSLSGNYNSIQELEADFNQKYSSIRGQVNEIESSRNAALNNAVSNTFNGNSTERAIGQGMQLIGGLINSGKAKKEEREAKEQLRRERERQIVAINAAKQKARIELRTQLIKNFPNGGTPLSAHKITAPEVYMFGYIFDKTTIANESANVSVSNVFPVAQYSDGSFPLRTTVSGKLQGIGRGEVVIIGYYTDKKAAEQMHSSFINLAKKSELAVNTVTLKTLSSNTASGSSGDFWETGAKSKPAATDTTIKKKNDFWNN